MSLRGRLNRLEHAPRRPGECPECGVDSTAPVQYNVIWPDSEDDEATEEPAVSSPACRRCGYRALTVLNWDGIVTDPDTVRAERERIAELEERRREYLKSRPDLAPQSGQIPDYPPSTWDGEAGGRG